VTNEEKNSRPYLAELLRESPMATEVLPFAINMAGIIAAKLLERDSVMYGIIKGTTNADSMESIGACVAFHAAKITEMTLREMGFVVEDE